MYSHNISESNVVVKGEKPKFGLGSLSKVIHFIFGIIGIVHGAQNMDNSCFLKDSDLPNLSIWMLAQGIILVIMATNFIQCFFGNRSYLYC